MCRQNGQEMAPGVQGEQGMKCAAILVLAVTLLAQDSRFGVRSRLVLVPVTVTDAKGHSADGLEESDFLVLDNGRPQKAIVDTIDTGVAPISLVIAVQSSAFRRRSRKGAKDRQHDSAIGDRRARERGVAFVRSESHLGAGLHQ